MVDRRTGAPARRRAGVERRRLGCSLQMSSGGRGPFNFSFDVRRIWSHDGNPLVPLPSYVEDVRYRAANWRPARDGLVYPGDGKRRRQGWARVRLVHRFLSQGTRSPGGL